MENNIKNDVLFFIDTSASNTSDQLKEIGIGIFNAIKTFGKEDRFNIIEFKSKAYPLFKNLSYPTLENIKVSKEYLNKISNTGNTNIHNTLTNILTGLPEGSDRNLIIYLISDGKISSNQLKENINFVKNILEIKRDESHILPFTNSSKPNSLILSLLAKESGGIYKHTKDIQSSSKELTEFINSNNNNFLKDISYKISNSVVKFTHPHKLPSFFENNQTIGVYSYYPCQQTS